MRSTSALTGKERFFDDSEIIVSKTDKGGRITYANDVFLRVSGYEEEEILSQPHSILRHPDMPRCIFHLLWETVQSGSEIFAYVVNRCKNGDHYWVLAHVTPSFDSQGEIIGYHSSRRTPDPDSKQAVIELYDKLKHEEEKHDHSMAGMQAASALLAGKLADQDVDYDEFVYSL